MSPIKIVKVHLLGEPYVEVSGERVHFPYKKLEGLFYFLCIQKNTTRYEIIQMFWSEEEEKTGKRNLREALYQLKKIFGKDFFVTVGRTSVGLNPDEMPVIDFEEEGGITDTEDLMVGFQVKNADEFNAWADQRRQEFHLRLAGEAQKKIQSEVTEKSPEYTRILLKRDPYNEELYYELMNMYADNGDYNMALRLYENLEKRLMEDLGVEPSRHVTTLFKEIHDMKNAAIYEKDGHAFFYGRTKEILRITEGLTRFSRKEATAGLALVGDSGVGKSILLQKTSEIAGNFNCKLLRMNCYRDAAEFFLRPWRELMEANYGEIQDKKIDETIFNYFETIIEKQQIVFIIDDIQWMDSMSFSMLNRIMEKFGQKHIFLIFSMLSSAEKEVKRQLTELYQTGGMKDVAVSGFSKEETGQIIEKVAKVELSQEQVEHIFELTGGNAFFLMEYANLIREKGYTLEISENLLNVMKSRLMVVSEKEEELLNCMAIFPERVSVEELELLYDGNRLELLRTIEQLEKRHFITESLEGWNVYYGFMHRIFKEFIYERQSMGRKLLMHQTMAEYYEKNLKKGEHIRQLPMIIYHYEHGLQRLETYRYKIQYYNEFYTLVHENFPVLQDEINPGEKQPSIESDRLMSFAKEVATWDDYSDEAMRLKMAMHYIAGRYCIAIGEYGEGKKHLETGIHIAKEYHCAEEQLNCYFQMVFYCVQIEATEKMQTYLDAIGEMVEARTWQKGMYLRLQGLLKRMQGDYSASEKVLKEAIAAFEKIEDGERYHSMNTAACYQYLGDIKRDQGFYQEAYDYYCTAIKTNQERVMTNGLAQFYSSAGQVLYHLNCYQEARKNLEIALSCFYKYGYRWGIGRAEAYLALLDLEEGDRIGAEAHYQGAVSVEKKIQNPTTGKLLQKLRKQLEVSD